jgi:hypothetical protein
LLVKNVQIGDDTITIRHSIPGQQSPRKAATYRQARLPAQVTFCIKGVLSPLLSNLVLDELDRDPLEVPFSGFGHIEPYPSTLAGRGIPSMALPAPFAALSCWPFPWGTDPAGHQQN